MNLMNQFIIKKKKKNATNSVQYLAIFFNTKKSDNVYLVLQYFLLIIILLLIKDHGSNAEIVALLISQSFFPPRFLESNIFSIVTIYITLLLIT